MFVPQETAQAIFDQLPNDKQYPTLNPAYLQIDLGDQNRTPLFWTSEAGPEIVLIGTSAGPAIDGLNDFESQRGYGGPTGTLPFDSIRWPEVWQAYHEDLTTKNGLANFVRFTPLLANHQGFPGRVVLDRSTVAIDLNQHQDPMQCLKTRARTAVRKAKKNGVHGIWGQTEDHWNSFFQLYIQRMKTLNASAQYLFGWEYFEQLRLWENAELLLSYCEDELLGGAIFLTSPEYWDYHLSASNQDGMRLCATQWMIWHACCTASEARFVHLGGGNSSNPEDPLLFFKRGFSDKSCTFYFGGQILADERYEHIRQRFEAAQKPTKRVLFYRD